MTPKRKSALFLRPKHQIAGNVARRAKASAILVYPMHGIPRCWSIALASATPQRRGTCLSGSVAGLRRNQSPDWIGLRRSGGAGLKCRGEQAFAFSKCSRKTISYVWAHGLFNRAGRNWEDVQLRCFLQTNENVTAHPKSRKLRLELAEKCSPSGTRVGAPARQPVPSRALRVIRLVASWVSRVY